MKLTIPLACLFVTSSALLAETPTLRVHEWGTFTVLLGSDGGPVPWWTPTLEGPASLPDFVAKNAFSQKTAAPSLVRMETPVLYFYPSGPMTANVSVRYPEGRITEVFPTAPGFVGALPPESTSNPPVVAEAPKSLFDAQAPTTWRINLWDPTNAVPLAKVPVVSDHGAHYRHAREVPGAWLVESSGQFEHFIFYRGAGEHQLPIHVVNIHDDVWQMSHSIADTAAVKAFQVRVKNSELRWAETQPIARMGLPASETRSYADAGSLDLSQTNLIQSLIIALTRAGLTHDEAAAMVHTWENAWMKEEGTRLLVLLPEEIIDAILPLTITPRPQETRRVFVARLELLDTITETRIGQVLDAWPKVSDEDLALAQSLGRTRSAAFQRAVQLRTNALITRSAEVQTALAP